MRIESVTDEEIRFDNGNYISFDYDHDCGERHWPDFRPLGPDVVDFDYDFDEDLNFKLTEGIGFSFGSRDEKGYDHRIYVLCYSDKSKHYSTEIDIYYNGHKVLSGRHDERIN